MSQPYAAVQTLLPSPEADLALRRADGWSLTLAFPALAAMLSFLAYVDVEVHLARGEVSGRLRPAEATSRLGRLIAASVLLSGLLLCALMIGHLIID